MCDHRSDVLLPGPLQCPQIYEENLVDIVRCNNQVTSVQFTLHFTLYTVINYIHVMHFHNASDISICSDIISAGIIMIINSNNNNNDFIYIHSEP